MMKKMTRTKTKKPPLRTIMQNKTATLRARDMLAEADGTYFLKLVMVVILGTLWLKFKMPMTWVGVPLASFPLGLLLGLAGISLFEKNPFDRRIWYAVLIVIAIICYFVPAGIIL